MKKISEEQIETIRKALEKHQHDGYENCAATVCELLTKAVRELNNLVEEDS